MSEQNGSQEALIAKTKSAFQRADYQTAYRTSAELMKSKTASVVVYMHCVSSLKLRVASKERVDLQINDTLLLATALDNFYKQSGMKNENIRTYISEILFTLMTSTIESIQKHYPMNSGRRSIKHAASDAQDTMTNLKILKTYDLSGFTVELPDRINAFLNETGDKLLDYMSKWLSVVRDATNNWLFEDNTNDLFERIMAYQTAVNASDEPAPAHTHYTDEEIKSFVSEVAEKSKPEKLQPKRTPAESEADTFEMPSDTINEEILQDEQPEASAEPAPASIKRSKGKASGLKSIDIVIGLLVILFVVVVSVIVIYAINPSLITSLFGG